MESRHFGSFRAVVQVEGIPRQRKVSSVAFSLFLALLEEELPSNLQKIHFF
jgi:hypothetical protein